MDCLRTKFQYAKLYERLGELAQLHKEIEKLERLKVLNSNVRQPNPTEM